MRKSPWVILAIGLVGVAAIAVMGKVYMGYNPALQLKADLAQQFGLQELSVQKNEETGDLTITYKPDPVAFDNKAVIEAQMAALARYAREKFSFNRVTVAARLSDEKTRTLVFDGN